MLVGLLATGSTSVADNSDIAVYHPSAVKGQTVELEMLAPPNIQSMGFYLRGQEQIIDHEPPFRFMVPTADLDTRKYRWGTGGKGMTCCDGQNNGGSLQIYPLPKVRAFKVSALIVAGTARVAGLVIAKVARNRVVRAWSYSASQRENGYFSLPLKLRRAKGLQRIYRLPAGFSLNVGKRTEIVVEVAPRRLVRRHGVEVRGRLARLWLTRDRRSGATHAHRSSANICTTAIARKADRSRALPFPGAQSCAVMPSSSVVTITCAKLEACAEGAAPLAARVSRGPGPGR